MHWRWGTFRKRACRILVHFETRVVSSNRTVGEKATDWQRHATQRERELISPLPWILIPEWLYLRWVAETSNQLLVLYDDWQLRLPNSPTPRWVSSFPCWCRGFSTSLAVMAGYKGGLTRYWICMSVSVNISNTSNNTSAQLSLVFGRVDQQWTHYSA